MKLEKFSLLNLVIINFVIIVDRGKIFYLKKIKIVPKFHSIEKL